MSKKRNKITYDYNSGSIIFALLYSYLFSIFLHNISARGRKRKSKILRVSQANLNQEALKSRGVFSEVSLALL